LFLEQKGAHNALLDALVTGAASVAARDGAFPLDGAANAAALQVLDSRQTDLAVAANGSLGLFGHALGNEFAARSAHAAVFVLAGVVGVASALAGPAGVGHNFLE